MAPNIYRTRRVTRISRSPIAEQAEIVNAVCNILESEYGRPDLGNPQDPIDDLIFVILTAKASIKTASNLLERIKCVYGSWELVANATHADLEAIIRAGGLGLIKSRQIIGSLRKLIEDFGSCTLESLRTEQVYEAQRYLTSLPGVSYKTAKCVMLYTLGFEVLPVDVHVHRIAKRLGWTSKNRADQSHSQLEELVPEKRRFAFHVDCVLHGQSICRPRFPSCEDCVINRHCRYFTETGRSRGDNGR